VVLHDRLRLVVEGLDATLSARRGDVSRVIDRTVDKGVTLLEEGLDTLVVCVGTESVQPPQRPGVRLTLEILGDSVDGTEHVVERTGERLDDASEERRGRVDMSVRLDGDLGSRARSCLADSGRCEGGVLADEAEEGLDRTGVLGVGLDLVDNLRRIVNIDDHGMHC
jgi:hypothetical protein